MCLLANMRVSRIRPECRDELPIFFLHCYSGRARACKAINPVLKDLPGCGQALRGTRFLLLSGTRSGVRGSFHWSRSTPASAALSTGV
jgi:hypothetical protein